LASAAICKNGGVTTRLQNDVELAEAEAKQVEADDQAIHLGLMGLPVSTYGSVRMAVDRNGLAKQQEYEILRNIVEYDFLVGVTDGDAEGENQANCILMTKLQGTASNTQADTAPI
ncbi:hypothetical protein Tco_0305755, partial [Tanacetum coccineum]